MSEIERMIECGICLEILDGTNKMLPCQHTYHRGCLENLLQNEGSIHCPMCRANVAEPINSLKNNIFLSGLVDQYRRNPPPAPRTEDEDLAQAITISREEFMNGSAADLLKQNEALQMQVALESSKRDALLESMKKETEAYQELFQYQVAIDKSEEDESIRKERQSMISDKEKLECELAGLKSMLDSKLTLSSGTTSGINSLLARVASLIGDLNDKQRTEAQMALQCIRGALTWGNNESTQKQFQAVIDKMVTNNNQKSSNLDPAKNGSEGQTDSAINDVMKNLKEIKTILREEGQTIQMAEHQNRNYLNQYTPNFIPPLIPGIPDPRMFGQRFPFYGPRPPFPAPYAGKELPPPPYYQPHPPAYYWPTPPHVFPPFPNGNENAPVNFPQRGKTTTRGRGGRGSGPGFNKFPNPRAAPNEIGSLILPDVKDYDRLEKKRDGKPNLYKNNTNFAQSSSSSKTTRGHLLLPDVRHYDALYSKFSDKLGPGGDKKCDIESSGNDYKGRRKSFDTLSESEYSTYKYTNRGGYRGKKPFRGRGGKGDRCYDSSKSHEKNDGAESDSSGTSMVSCSSRVSTCSTSVLPSNSENKSKNYQRRHRNPHPRGNRSIYRGKNNGFEDRNKEENHPKPEICPTISDRPRSPHPRGNRNNFRAEDNGKNKQENDMKRLIYPSKKEAIQKNIDLMKRFDIPVICLGKDADKPVSKTVDCLADVYKFEETYQECRVIRI